MATPNAGDDQLTEVGAARGSSAAAGSPAGIVPDEQDSLAVQRQHGDTTAALATSRSAEPGRAGTRGRRPAGTTSTAGGQQR